MDDLVQWLGQQLDEDEQIAREATPGPWRNAPTARHHATASRRSEEAVFASPPDTGATVVATTGEAVERRHLVDAEFIARHDPARVLREIDAKRQMLADVQAEPHFMSADDHWNTCPAVVDEDGVPVCLDESRAPGPCECGRDARVARRLRLLALPYADRPGYRDDWRP